MGGRANILYLASGMNACSWYRCVTPGQALAAVGYQVRLSDSLAHDDIQWADVVVFQRLHFPAVLEAIQYARALGKLTVYEIDDDLWNVHPDSGAHAAYARPGVLQITEEAIRRCDLVTTTTTYLGQRLAPMNRAVKVLPNMLPDSMWNYDEPVQQREDRVVIGWAGSNTHLPDLKILRGVVEQLLDRYDNLEFAWAGMSQMPFQDHRRMRMLPPVPLEQYPELLGNFHIGIAPVLDSVFNASKSDLKYLEYAGRGIPTVASRTTAYEGTIQHGETGFLARNGKDWLKALSRLVEDVDLRRRIGAAAMSTASSRMMSRNTALWEQAYGLVNGRD